MSLKKYDTPNAEIIDFELADALTSSAVVTTTTTLPATTAPTTSGGVHIGGGGDGSIDFDDIP